MEKETPPSPSHPRRRCYGLQMLEGRILRGSGFAGISNILMWPVVVAVTVICLASWCSEVSGWSPAVSEAKRGVSPLASMLTPASATNKCYSLGAPPSSLSMSSAKEDTASKTGDTSNEEQISSSVQQLLREQKQDKPPTIITCSSTKELVHAVESIVTSDHVVAEFGSQLREVSNTIRDRASPDSVYVDVKRNFPKTQTKETPQKETKRTSSMRLATSDEGKGHTEFDFREIDKFADWRSAFFRSSSSSSSNRYDVLVLDVNAIVGNDLEWTCLDLALEFEQMAAMVAAENRNHEADSDGSYHGLQYVLVKSLGLNSVASQLTYTAPWLDPNKSNHSRLCRIVATVGVHDYRQTIPGVLNLLQQSHPKAKSKKFDGDEETPQSSDFFVLEVGCHFGTSTILLNDVFDNVMGVDVGSKIIKEAQKKFPDVFFRAGDAWKTAGLLRLQQEYHVERGSNDNKIGFDAVYVDVGGLSGADGLLDTIALVKSIQYSLEPQCIVVKSLCLHRLASRFTSYWKWQKKGKVNSTDSPIN